jgi:hypothetical protein
VDYEGMISANVDIAQTPLNSRVTSAAKNVVAVEKSAIWKACCI